MTKRKRGSRKEKDSEKEEPEKVREEPETEQVDEDQRPSKLRKLPTLHLVTTQRTQALRLTQTGTQFVCECSAVLHPPLVLSVSTLAEVPIGTRNACSNAGFTFLFAGLCF